MGNLISHRVKQSIETIEIRVEGDHYTFNGQKDCTVVQPEYILDIDVGKYPIVIVDKSYNPIIGPVGKGQFTLDTYGHQWFKYTCSEYEIDEMIGVINVNRWGVDKAKIV